LWETKRWPEERFAELARALGGAGVGVALLGGPEDRELCARIRAAAAGPGVAATDLAGRTSLRASYEIIRRAACLVTNDSLPMHLGVAAGVPVIGIYCSTVPAFGFAPRGPQDVVVEVEGLDCRPCGIHGHRACPLGHFRCGKDLDAARVLREVRRHLSVSV
jgi:heptosyltransferase-2